MDAYEFALLVGAVAAAAASWGSWRRVAWIVVGTVNFAVTTTYARHLSVLPPALFTGLFDAATVALIYTLARYRWEMALAAVFQVMVLTSLVYLTPVLDDRYIYVVALEVLNWLALVVVAGTRMMEIADDRLAANGWGGLVGPPVHRLSLLARAERKHKTGPFSFLAR